MHKKHIIVATGLYPPEGGGPAKHTVMMEKELPQYGWRMTVVPFARVRAYPKAIRHAAYLFLLLKAAHKADIIFAQDAVSVGVPAMVAAKLLRKKFVVRIPGEQAWEAACSRWGVGDTLEAFQHKKYGWRIEFLRKLGHLIVRSAHMVIAPSEYMARIAHTWLPKNRAVTMIPNGIEMPVVVEMPMNRPTGPLIASIGRLVPWKHMDGVIALLAEDTEWHAVIVGEGQERARLEAYAMELGVRNRVIFAGSVSNAIDLGWCASADVFVLNSSYEGMSHVLVEMMALGVPIVATGLEANRAILTDEVDGLLVPVGDHASLLAAVRKQLHHPQEAQAMAEAAQEHAQRYNVKRTAKELSDALKTL